MTRYRTIVADPPWTYSSARIMFARRARLSGWDYWGDQSLGTAELGSQNAA